jgi:hypothetical protein
LTAQPANRCIIFLHLPKTGGVTLRGALKWKYAPEMLNLETLTKPDYGVHEYMPQRCDYITLLREPVARVVSYYYYVLGHPKHWRHAEMVRSGMSLDEFAETSPERGVENDQTRILSGKGAGELDAGVLGRKDLDEAKRNLERFLVVGVTERFDESFILIRRALGWKFPWYVTANVATGAKPASVAALESIRERNQLDLELYEFARELLSAAIERHGESLQREVAVFRALNRVPNRIHPYTGAPVRRLLRGLPR